MRVVRTYIYINQKAIKEELESNEGGRTARTSRNLSRVKIGEKEEREPEGVKKHHRLLSKMVDEHRQTAAAKTKGCWSLGHKAD